MITVCIPTFQRAPLLKKAISSALSQTVKNLRILIADNASQDNTREIVSDFAKNDPRIHFISHKENIGMLPNYEFLFSLVETEYFAFLSDDDVWFPDFCETALNGFSLYPDIVFFACSTICFSKEKGILKNSLDPWPEQRRFSPPEGAVELIGKYPFPMNVLFHKTALSKAKIDFENSYAWDSDFLIQLAAQSPFAISKKVGGLFLHHSGSLTSTQSSQIVLKCMARLQERIQSFPWLDPTSKRIAVERVNLDIYKSLKSAIVFELMQKNFAQAKEKSRSLLKKSKNKFYPLLLFLVSTLCLKVPFASIFLKMAKKTQTFYRKTLKWARFYKYRSFSKK